MRFNYAHKKKTHIQVEVGQSNIVELQLLLTMARFHLLCLSPWLFHHGDRTNKETMGSPRIEPRWAPW